MYRNFVDWRIWGIWTTCAVFCVFGVIARTAYLAQIRRWLGQSVGLIGWVWVWLYYCNLLWLLSRVELHRNTYSRVDTVDTVPRADVSVQNVDRSVGEGGRAALPDPLQFVRHRHRFTYAHLAKKNISSLLGTGSADTYHQIPIIYTSWFNKLPTKITVNHPVGN